MDDGLAKDLVAMWQSELTAMAADRELRETWTALLALWAGAAAAARPHDWPAGNAQCGQAGAAEPAGTPPAAAASYAGLDEVERLGRRVHDLEQRLAAFDLTPARPRSRKRPRNGDA